MQKLFFFLSWSVTQSELVTGAVATIWTQSRPACVMYVISKTEVTGTTRFWWLSCAGGSRSGLFVSCHRWSQASWFPLCYMMQISLQHHVFCELPEFTRGQEYMLMHIKSFYRILLDQVLAGTFGVNVLLRVTRIFKAAIKPNNNPSTKNQMWKICHFFPTGSWKMALCTHFLQIDLMSIPYACGEELFSTLPKKEQKVFKTAQAALQLFLMLSLQD